MTGRRPGERVDLTWPPRSAPKPTRELHIFAVNYRDPITVWLLRLLVASALLVALCSAGCAAECDPNVGNNDARALTIVSACALGLAVLLRRFTR